MFACDVVMFCLFPCGLPPMAGVEEACRPTQKSAAVIAFGGPGPKGWGSQTSVIDSKRRRLKCRHPAVSGGRKREVNDDRQRLKESARGQGPPPSSLARMSGVAAKGGDWTCQIQKALARILYANQDVHRDALSGPSRTV